MQQIWEAFELTSDPGTWLHLLRWLRIFLRLLRALSHRNGSWIPFPVMTLGETPGTQTSVYPQNACRLAVRSRRQVDAEWPTEGQVV